MEKHINIQTNDGFTIYGTLNSVNNSKNPLLIFVHGITGNQFEHQYLNAVPFFTPRGFDTFRFDFYSKEENGRNLSECNISTHVSDLRLVINNFKNEYKRIYLVGHSLGAFVILNLDLSDIEKVVFWDPTKGFKNPGEKNIRYVPELGKYVWQKNMEIMISKEMVEQWQLAINPEELVKKLNKPCKFIFAEFGSSEHWEKYFQFLNVEYERFIVNGSSHCFVEEGTISVLYKETLKWIIG